MSDVCDYFRFWKSTTTTLNISPIRGGHAPYPTDMPFGVSSGIPDVIIHAKFHVDRLRGFWAAGPPKVPFPILIGTITSLRS